MAAPKATTPPPRSVETLTLDIPCYSEIKKNLPNGNGITSDAVVAGGHSWHISFYPNGRYPDTTDATSVSLLLDDANAGGDAVQVELKFMLLEFGGGDPPHFVSSTFTRSFSPGKPSIGINLSPFVSHEDLDESVLAKHDRFTIRCDFAVQPPPGSEATAGVAVQPPSHRPDPSAALPNLSGLPADLGRLLETKQGADIEFEVCGQIFAAHKLVLAARSSVFNDDFFGSMKEEDTNYIRISDIHPEAFKSLLRHMYTDRLPETLLDSCEEEVAELAEGLLVAADRYNLKVLKSLTEKLIGKQISAATVLPILALAEQHECQKLKKKCLKFIASHKNTRTTIATEDDFEHLARNCPALAKEVVLEILDTREEEDQAMMWLICTFAFGFLFCVIMMITMSMMK